MSGEPPELVRLTVVPTEGEAEVIRGLLATEGIECLLRPTDAAAGALDGSAGGGAREILVREADLETAQALIAAPEA